MAAHSSDEQVDTVLAQLRAEEPIEPHAERQILLRHESAVLEKTRGDAGRFPT
jgi:hypothetical protein